MKDPITTFVATMTGKTTKRKTDAAERRALGLDENDKRKKPPMSQRKKRIDGEYSSVDLYE